MASVINSAGVLLMLPSPLSSSPRTPARLSINSEGRGRESDGRQGHVDDGGGGMHGAWFM